MDEFNQDNYFFNTYYKSNHEDFTNKFSLKHSLNKKKYIDIENLDYDIESKNLLSNKNINSSQDSIKLIQIKNDLDLLNDKMNKITEALSSLNIFNNTPKKIINLKRNSSINNKNINIINNKNKNQVNIINQKYSFNDSINKNNSNINDIIYNIKGNNNKNLSRNHNFNDTFNYNSYNDNYVSESMNLPKNISYDKIKNIKLRQKDSNLKLNTKTIKKNKFNFDQTLNLHAFLMKNSNNKKKFIKPKNNNYFNQISNNNKNLYFGMYDKYFIDTLGNKNLEDNNIEGNFSEKNNIIKRTLISKEFDDKKIESYKKISDFLNKNEKGNLINQSKNFINKEDEMENKKIIMNENNDKKIPNEYKAKIELIKSNNNYFTLKSKYPQKLETKKKDTLLGKLINFSAQSQSEKEDNQVENKNIININEEQENQKEKYINIISEKEIENNIKKEKKTKKSEKKVSNKKYDIQNNKKENKMKNITFHEEDNITIEYNKKDKITNISVFDFFGENKNFNPRNINVILEKLKRNKSKNKSILLNNNSQNKLIADDKLNSLNKSNKFKKIKKSNSAKSVSSNNEKKILSKYKLRNKKSDFIKKNYIIKKRICEKFKNNPQLFYSEELCDLVIKSLDLEKDNDKSRNKYKTININNSFNKRKNMTDIDVETMPITSLHKIIEEAE